MFIGSIGEKEYAFILESKQWGDDYITGAQFSEFRGNDVLLYPQVQVHHHEISFKNYLNIGTRVAKVYPYVYLENATQIGVNKVLQNPDPNSKRIPVITDMNVFINKIIELGLNPGITGIADLYDAKYFPSKDILTAMSSLIEKEEPFVLTESQEKKVQEIYSAVNSGNKIIHISGPAGSGKTAILLNLFVRLLKKAPETGYTPLFAPGGQNTSVYRTLYPQISDMFAFTFGMQKHLYRGSAAKTILLIDEGQSNQNGMIQNFVNSGAVVIFCYDENQIVNLDNSISELPILKTMPGYKNIKLTESVRFNGSQVYEINVNKCLNGDMNFIPDDKFYFKVATDMEDLRSEIKKIRDEHPDSTMALSGLLCDDAQQIEAASNGLFFLKWKKKNETEWIPYIMEKNYENKYDGKYWLGTWWLPGLDVDYNVVVVGGDAIMTNDGIVGDRNQSKLVEGIRSILNYINVPQVDRNRGVCSSINNFLQYCSMPGNEGYKDTFNSTVTTLIKNYYYIMLTRARKGNVLGEFGKVLINFKNKTVLSHILKAISDTLQLYFDFSGYSDMAIGIGLILGFEFLENFNYPLIASSITDFWRRWHISLSSWFRDYVYIPLGGNRKGKLRTYLNIFIVWLLTGFWHGANWNFIIWGLYFAIILIAEKVFLLKALSKTKVIAHIYSIFIIVIGFVIFNQTSLNELGEYLKNMFGFGGLSFTNLETNFYFKNYLAILIVSALLSTPILKIALSKIKNNIKYQKYVDIIEMVVCFALLIVCTSYIINQTYNPFLYFRF